MKQTLLGNAISLVAAAFIAASCCMHDTRKVSLLQIGANLVLALSSVVLGAWSGLVTLLLSSLRMLLILYNTYNRRQMVVFCVLTVAVGLWVNTRGLLGLLPIVATVQLTVQSYLAHDLYSVKRSIARNLLFGAICCAFLLDIVSGVCDLINFILGVVALCRMRRAPAKTGEPSSAQSVEQTEKPPRKGRFFRPAYSPKYSFSFPTNTSQSMPCTMQASSSVSPAAEGHPMQNIPCSKNTGAAFMSRSITCWIVISFVIFAIAKNRSFS